MPLSSGDRVLAGLACAYFSYRVLSAIKTGVYDGDGDRDVHSDRYPSTFLATLFSGAVVALICAILAFAPQSLVRAAAQQHLHDQQRAG